MSADAKVLQRLAKMLAIAKSTNFAEEAQTALLMAQQIMAEHGLTKEQVEGSARPTNTATTRSYERGIRDLDTWVVHLGSVIAANFRCTLLYDQRGSADGSYRVSFVGLLDDIKTTVRVYRAAKQVVLHLGREYLAQRDLSRRGKAGRAQFEKYAAGFCIGLHERFQQQVRARGTSFALVVQTPQEVKDYLRDLGAAAEKHIGGAVPKGDQAADAGYHAGTQWRETGWVGGGENPAGVGEARKPATNHILSVVEVLRSMFGGGSWG